MNPADVHTHVPGTAIARHARNTTVKMVQEQTAVKPRARRKKTAHSGNSGHGGRVLTAAQRTQRGTAVERKGQGRFFFGNF